MCARGTPLRSALAHAATFGIIPEVRRYTAMSCSASTSDSALIKESLSSKSA